MVPGLPSPHPDRPRAPTVVRYNSPEDWTARLIKDCSGNFDLIAEHCYGDAHRFDIAAGHILDEDVDESVLDSCRRAPNRIRLKREYWERYTRDFPQLACDGIKLSIDEWGFRNARGLRQTLGLAMTLHELFRSTDFITMAGFTMGTSWIDHDRLDGVYSAAGVLFRLYRDRFGTLPLTVGSNAPQPAPKWPVGGDQPMVNAGSATFPLDLAAALSADRRTLTVAAVNATDRVQATALTLAGFRAAPRARRWRLTGPGLDAQNRVGRPAEVTVVEAAVDGRARSIEVAPYSVELYAFDRA